MVKIRKLVTVVEAINSDGGREARRPLRKAAAVAVIDNPFAGRFVDDLTPLIDAGEELGALLAKKATEALGAPAESYGKAAVVGEGGEYEHAAALLHPKLGAPLRAAIEVYPHSALVSLFELARTIKYKSRPGRLPVARRAAFDDLLARLRALAGLDPPLDVTTSPRWEALQTLVAAGRLAAVEDELDAYVCAYVAIYHRRWHGRRSLVVGDVASGYIVTPVDDDADAALRAWGARLAVPVS